MGGRILRNGRAIVLHRVGFPGLVGGYKRIIGSPKKALK